MLLKDYEAQQLFANVSVNGPTSESGVNAYRGDLVLIQGDLVDGRPLPPKAVIRQAAVLEKDGKLTLVAGGLDELAHVASFIERYRHDLAADVKVLFYVGDLTKPLSVDVDGVGILLIPHEEGAIWNTLMDDLRLDKEDFKGQSAEDKVITMAEGVADYRPNVDIATLDEAKTFVSARKKEHRGPV